VAIAQDKLHPKARAIVDAFAKAPPLASLTPEQARALPLPLEAAPEPVGAVTSRAIPGPGGFMRLRIYRPKTVTRGVLVYFHGGGWVLGSLEGADATCRALTNRGEAAVVSVDYRLAPETKFPGPVEDAFAAVRWVAASAAELGVDPAPLAVGGTSAGGNLAAAAALVARDRDGPPIALQLLMVPVTDLRTTTASFEEFAEGYGLTRSDMEWFARHYVVTEKDAENPYASVARGDLRGMPPAFVITAECDPLRDDGEAYAERLRELGIGARHKRYPRMQHGFIGFPDQLPEASEALDDAGATLRAAFGA
jgi:acetyl esterase